MTIQLPAISVSEPSLLTDSYAPNAPDNSFNEELKLAQTRLGFIFMPSLSRFDFLFSNSLFSSQEKSSPASRLPQSSQQENFYMPEKETHSQAAPQTNSTQIFEPLPPQSFRQNFMRQILSQTNWLVPNIEGQPLLMQAYEAGKLKPNFDMQSLIDEIAAKVQLVKDKGKTQLSLLLKPEDLGQIFLSISSRAGVVSIQIQSSPETKKLINSKRQELETALKKAHVNFDTISIEEVEKNAV